MCLTLRGQQTEISRQRIRLPYWLLDCLRGLDCLTCGGLSVPDEIFRVLPDWYVSAVRSAAENDARATNLTGGRFLNTLHRLTVVAVVGRRWRYHTKQKLSAEKNWLFIRFCVAFIIHSPIYFVSEMSSQEQLWHIELENFRTQIR